MSEKKPVDRFKHACRLHTGFTIARYLMSNAAGRCDGAEKAQRHRELCQFYVAAVRGHKDPERVDTLSEDYLAVHRKTQELTDYLDTAIGFPLDRRPDYDTLEPKFFEKFHELALAALDGEGPAA